MQGADSELILFIMQDFEKIKLAERVISTSYYYIQRTVHYAESRRSFLIKNYLREYVTLLFCMLTWFLDVQMKYK